MSEAVSALGGARFDGLVKIAEAAPTGMITLRGDLASAAVSKAVRDVAGQDVPDALEARGTGTHGLCWMAPDELLLLCPYPEVDAALDTMRAALGSEHALAVDVSDARAVFMLTGARLRDVVVKLTPADMSPEATPVGRFRRSRLAQIPAAFWLREEEVMQIICFRSVADYAFGALCAAAAPGSDPGYFGGGAA